MAEPTSTAAAARLAERLNYIPTGVFALWLGPIPYMWLQAFGPLLPYDWPPPALPPLPWFAAAVAGGLVMLVLPRGWYRPRRAEHKVYRLLAVRHFRRLATNGDVIIRQVRQRYPGYTVHRQDFSRALQNTFTAEKVHLVFLMFGMVTSAYAIAISWHGWAAWSIATNLAGNFYPVLLQRYTRARLVRLKIA